MNEIDSSKSDIIPLIETQTEIRMTETFDDIDSKEDQMIQDYNNESSKDQENTDPINNSTIKKNTQINFKVIKNKNKHLEMNQDTNNIIKPEEEDKKKELEMLLDKFTENINRKKTYTDNYVELLIGKLD